MCTNAKEVQACVPHTGSGVVEKYNVNVYIFKNVMWTFTFADGFSNFLISSLPNTCKAGKKGLLMSEVVHQPKVKGHSFRVLYKAVLYVVDFFLLFNMTAHVLV